MEKMIKVARRCPFCGKEYTVEVPEKGFLDWFFDWCEGSALIQNAMPNVSAEVRESLISGICEECQNKFFGDCD